MFSAALILLLAAGSCVNSIDLIQPDSMIVQPGQTLTITCRLSGYSLTDSSYGTGWIRQHEGKAMDWIVHQWGSNTLRQNDALKNKFSYRRDTSAGTVTITGRNMQPEDSAVYYCVRVRGGYWGYFDYWGRGTEVTVTSATTAQPTVFPLVPCDSATENEITLGCLAYGFYPKSATFVWTDANSKTLDSHQYISGPSNNGNYTGVSVIKVPASDSSAYKCSVNHPGGNKYVTVKHTGSSQIGLINVSVSDWKEPKVTIHILPEDHIDQEVTLVCLVSSPKEQEYDIKWREDEGSNTGVFTAGINFPSLKTKNTYSVISLYITTKEKWNGGYTFKCNVQCPGSNGTMEPRSVSKAMSNAIEC